jgi:hypothetical protein
MANTAERMKAMRQRRRAQGLRELSMVISDARDPAFRRHVAQEVSRLDPSLEGEAMRWIEGASLFDESDATR